MTDLRQAAEQAREALEMMLEFPKTGPASTAARAALASLEEALSSPAKQEAVATLPKDVAESAIDALETALTGLQWYRGVMPEYVDGSDDEADEQINAAIEALRGSGSTEPQAWTTYAHIHASKFGKSGLFVQQAGGVFCVPVYFGPAKHVEDHHNDPT